MVQPSDIKRKAERIYGEYLCAWAAGEVAGFFPRQVPTERRLGADVVEAAKLVQALRAGSKAVVGYGYTVEWQEVNSRTLGRNSLPQRVLFDTPVDLLRFIGKQAEFKEFSAASSKIRSAFPSLAPWVSAHPRAVVNLAPETCGLLAVLRYLADHPRPDCFPRELPVPVDTKFVERHKGVLRQWLDLVLPAHAVRADEEQFELRYGLRYADPLVPVRFLDPEGQRAAGFPCSALSLPLHTLGGLPRPADRVVIVENRVNLLTLPRLRRCLAVGGMGNGAVSLRHVDWLHRVPVAYWGDIDVEGLEILSRIRTILPHTRSLMMDANALLRWRHLGGLGTGRSLLRPPRLTDGEGAAFTMCVDGNTRLEQERIPLAEANTSLMEWAEQ